MKCSLALCARAVVFAVLVVSSDAAFQRAAVGTPVERVVNLLKDLKEKLTADEKSEQQAYDKFACWCEKTSARKADAITLAQTDLRDLGQTILTAKGRIATLASEIEGLVADIKANKAAQAQATSLRERENAAFMGETAEMKQAILALEQAITVLKDGTSFLQSQEQATMLVKAVIARLPTHTALKPGHVAELQSFVQAKAGTSYMPQSLTVQGILTDMYTTFATDLESATRAEAVANRAFEDLIALKTDELIADERSKAQREDEKAEQEAHLADTQQIYDDTSAQKAADIAFFDETKKACLSKHDDWTTRSSLRDEEVAGISRALDILTTDSARELFASAIKDGKETRADESYDSGRDITYFFQTDSLESNSAPSSQAYLALKKEAAASHSFRLAALAVKVREAKVGHFDKVISEIDELIKVLKTEDADDIAKRDQCKDEYQSIASVINNVTWLIEKNDAKIAKLETLIALRQTQKEETIQQIDETVKIMEQLNSTREGENEAFKQAKSEDQQAIDLLMDARSALWSYYQNHSVALGPIQGAVKGLAFAQQPDFDVSADETPDTVFSGKGKRKDEAKGILQILTTIIEDLNDEIRNGMKAEEAAQLDYEDQMRAANKLKDELEAKKVSLEQAISDRGEDKLAEETDKGNNEDDLNAEKTYKASIKDDCDFIIRTFEKRAAARSSEISGLVGAKEYLAGYQAQAEGAALLEKRPAFDDRALANTQFLGLAR